MPLVKMIGRSREGAWIEIELLRVCAEELEVAPVRERGLKLNNRLLQRHHLPVAPVRERGLKLAIFLRPFLLVKSSLP